MSLADARTRYALLTPDARRVRLLSEHPTQAEAFAAFRGLEDDRPCLLVRLEEFGHRQITVLASRGVVADGLETDPAFLDAVRRATGLIRSRCEQPLW